MQLSRQHGLSMVEVLVALALSGFALLALGSASATAVRYTKMAQYRATAMQLATDIGERMRANKGSPAQDGSPATGFLAGDYDFLSDFASQASGADLPAQLCNTPTSNCTPAQIAALDLALWRRLVREQLPQGSVYLQRQSAAAAADLWLVWRDPAVAATDEAPALAQECPPGLGRGQDSSLRCSYFRINL